MQFVLFHNAAMLHNVGLLVSGGSGGGVGGGGGVDIGVTPPPRLKMIHSPFSGTQAAPPPFRNSCRDPRLHSLMPL